MCTLTFCRSNNKTIITSNRDENIHRLNAEPPRKFVYGNTILYYPIDPISNGTWFCLKNNGNLLVLLNGSDIIHVPNPPYRKSRGLIILDIIQTDNYQETWAEMDLNEIEPFTLVAFYKEKLIQFSWNGEKKDEVTLDSNVSHIWSSSTLYSVETKEKRKQRFKEFLNMYNGTLDGNDLLQFHSTCNFDHKTDGLTMNRNNTILTKNVTQCVLEESHFILTHHDLILNKQNTISQ